MNMNMNIAGAAATIAVASIVANLSADRLTGGGSVTDGTAEGAKMGEDVSGIATVTPAASAATAAVATLVVNPIHQPPPAAVCPQCAERLQSMSGVVSSPLHQRPKMMRRIAVKLLQQNMLFSAEDD